MRGFHIERNSCWRLGFDPVKKEFVQQHIRHPFLASNDCLALHQLQDIGVDADALAVGRLTLLETEKPAKIENANRKLHRTETRRTRQVSHDTASGGV